MYRDGSLTSGSPCCNAATELAWVLASSRYAFQCGTLREFSATFGRTPPRLVWRKSRQGAGAGRNAARTAAQLSEACSVAAIDTEPAAVWTASSAINFVRGAAGTLSSIA
jgi:hypothetical protein